MKILLIADTESKYIWDYFDSKAFEDIDFILAAGDLNKKYMEFVTTVTKKVLYYVRGNHDKNYKANPPLGCICIEDKVINIKGIKIMGLGGSMRYSKGDNQYTDRQMLKRYNKLRFSIYKNKGIDILLTHAPAYGVCDSKDLCHTGFKVFNDIIQTYKPSYFIHGHQHLNYDYKLKRIYSIDDTTCVNAFNYYVLDYKKSEKTVEVNSIMDVLK